MKKIIMKYLKLFIFVFLSVIFSNNGLAPNCMVMLAVLIIALPSKGDRMYLNCAQFKPKWPIFLSQIKLTKHQNLMIKSTDF